VLLLDGMDEVADVKTRERVARLIEKFIERYPDVRCVVTSREVGYEGAARALARIESGAFNPQYWKMPYGEPQWVTIPAGEFWMGDDSSQYDDEKPAHKVFLPEFQIAKVPITNAQYEIYVQDTGKETSSHWRGGKVPKGLENHPVVNVSWVDALDYCAWLSEKTEKQISLPSEASGKKLPKDLMTNTFASGEIGRYYIAITTIWA
jgi:formylglycine-generating enzyme required for sulfatase activity